MEILPFPRAMHAAAYVFVKGVTTTATTTTQLFCICKYVFDVVTLTRRSGLVNLFGKHWLVFFVLFCVFSIAHVGVLAAYTYLYCFIRSKKSTQKDFKGIVRKWYSMSKTTGIHQLSRKSTRFVSTNLFFMCFPNKKWKLLSLLPSSLTFPLLCVLFCAFLPFFYVLCSLFLPMAIVCFLWCWWCW